MFQIRTGGCRLQQTVPLLRGMRRFQVHRILKTGEIGHIDAGDSLFDQGGVADRVYVVISGVFGAVMTESSGGHGHDERRTHMPKRVNRLRVGDMIGKMGLLTSGNRCVSVISVAPGEVLALSQKQLGRIRRRYPYPWRSRLTDARWQPGPSIGVPDVRRCTKDALTGAKIPLKIFL
jgi:CRP-like cAMP-binding protein